MRRKARTTTTRSTPADSVAVPSLAIGQALDLGVAGDALAALGPRMVELGAREADGLILNWLTPEHAARIAAGDSEARIAALNEAVAGLGAINVSPRDDQGIVRQVPLIWSWSGRLPAGRRVESLVSLVDLMPTILDLVGIPLPAPVEPVNLSVPITWGPAPAGDKQRALVDALERIEVEHEAVDERRHGHDVLRPGEAVAGAHLDGAEQRRRPDVPAQLAGVVDHSGREHVVEVGAVLRPRLELEGQAGRRQLLEEHGAVARIAGVGARDGRCREGVEPLDRHPLVPCPGRALAAGALTLFGATYLGIPVSTTHTITGAIVGVGSTQRASAVRWGVAGNIIWAWIFTIPASAFVAAVAYWASLQLF